MDCVEDRNRKGLLDIVGRIPHGTPLGWEKTTFAVGGNLWPKEREHKKSKGYSKRYLFEHPDAAALYLYAEDLPSNGAEAECIQGTISKLVKAKCIPHSKMEKGMACYVLPGTVEFNGVVKWTKSYYVARKHGSMSAHFTFDVEPGRSYAAVFNTASSGAKIIHLGRESRSLGRFSVQVCGVRDIFTPLKN